jgi:hypothetical protein
MIREESIKASHAQDSWSKKPKIVHLRTIRRKPPKNVALNSKLFLFERDKAT